MSKWFFEPLIIAAEKMNAMYGAKSCSWQIIEKERVVEHWLCEKGDKKQEVMLVIIRHGSDTRVSILIYELDLVASNHISK